MGARETIKVLHARIVEVIRRDPIPAHFLAERFGVSTKIVTRIAREAGVALPKTEYLSHKRRRRKRAKRESSMDLV